MAAIGYARVCTRDRSPALQHDALTDAGWTRGFPDVGSGAKLDRPLAVALDYLRHGDTLAEFERDLLRERTRAGLAAIAGRARGRQGGRPRKMTPETIAIARQMYDAHTYTVAQIAHTRGVSRGTSYQHLDQRAAV